ncbi:MAG: beta-lactamase family protein [bacterium]|nr:beta-lactamase family protein [bacterium]
MIRKKYPIILLVLILSICLQGCSPTAGSDRETERKNVLRILKDRVDTYRQSVGIVVGIIDETGRRVYSYGKMAKNRPTVDGDTLFEIGSITKVFTAIILADMAQKKELKLQDPVSQFLPKIISMPHRKGKEITLLDLATHYSGLPRMPNNFAPVDQKNPYADYSVEQMYHFLSNFNLTRDIGQQYEYSNFGLGLLGHALSLKAGTGYETLVTQRILKPLNMTHTVITITPGLKARFATPHNIGLDPVSPWDIPTLAGAGALRSSANDMLKFLAANIGLTKSPLSTAFEKTHTPLKETPIVGGFIGLCWHLLQRRGSVIISHGGGTGGFRTFCGFDKEKRKGVVVLCNSANDASDIGRHLLNPKFELHKLEPPPKEAAVDVSVLKNYVGKYLLTPGAPGERCKETVKL